MAARSAGPPRHATTAPSGGPVAARLAALRGRAIEAHMKGDTAAARPLYAQYLMLQPGDGQIWTNVGAMMRKEGRHDVALECQRRAYAATPTATSVRQNYANILADLGHNDEALEIRQALLRETPDDQQLISMIGKSLRSLRREEESCRFLERAWNEAPEFIEHGIQLSLSQLAAGEYTRGFATYDVRWQTDELTPRTIEQPKWDGVSDLTGKRILVMPEQGFGDGIAFARFLPILRDFSPDKVYFAAEKPVQRLYEGVDGADWVGATMPADMDFDCWTNIMDLPTLHFARHREIPPPVRINVPEDSTARARGLLGAYRKTFNVGVVWTGSMTYRGNAFRSFSHREFLALADVPDVQMFSLYKGPAAEAFREDGTSFVIVDEGSNERDFGDCAAMMRELDLVITSDTATAHLAGSLGVPVWTLLHWDAFWLWQLEEATTPWYPGMELIRQSRPRDWTDVFGQVRQRLVARVDAWREEKA